MTSQDNDRDFQLLEDVLVCMHPKDESMPRLAATLKQRFGSFDAAFSASAFVLQSCGVAPRDALLLSHMKDIARYVLHDEFKPHPQLGHLELAAEYLLTNFIGLKVERFYMLCLNSRGRLMENIFLQEGTADGALFDLKRMLAHVVRVSPSAVVLSHNHPMQTMRPSQPDLDCTYDAIRALGTLGIPLLDHVIMAGNQAVSMRQNGFIPAAIWLRQRPDHPLIQKWLTPPKEGQADKNLRNRFI